MHFIIPKKKTMKKLYSLAKKFYKRNAYDFFKELGQRIFFITSHKENFVVILSPEDNKFEIFSGEDGFLCCHNLLSGDDRAIRSYGINSLLIEEHDPEDEICGLEYYTKKYKFYKNNNKEVIYYANKAGQKPLVVDEDDALFIINVFQKLLYIEKGLKKHNYNKYEEEMVYVFDFNKSRNKFALNYELLETFDFFPKITCDPITDGRFASKLSQLEVKPGTLHIGQVYGFTTYEIYDNLAEIDIALCPIYFYGITDDGKLQHMIYSTPKEDSAMISTALATMFFEKHGLYDTIITDNIFIYNNLYYTFKSIGVELIFDVRNAMNTFITKFMIKMSQINQDVNAIDEIINDSKDELRRLLISSMDDLDELNETFFEDNLGEEIIVEEENYEDDEQEELEEDYSSEYVS